MTLQQLETLMPKRPVVNIDAVLRQKRRQTKRLLVRTNRRVGRWTRSQYYLSAALADSRRALLLNEDIALACLFITAVASFATISILSKIIFTFVMAASILSTLSGTNLALLILAAFTILTVLTAWCAALFQNSLSIALMEGATRKRNRSLRKTLRRSLRYASRTACGWIMLTLAAFGPAGAAGLIGVAVPYLLHSSLATNPIYLMGIGIISLSWIMWVLANFTLFPYVLLFETFTSWQAAARRSRRLVRSRGKLFALSGQIAFGLSLFALYGIALIAQKLTHINSTICFLLFSTVAVSGANAVLTLFYRKRKLARK